MTQKRKFNLALSSLLLLALLLAFVLPFAFQSEAYAAPPVVPDKDTWVNTYSGSYYNNLNTNLTGTAFRSELANLITTTHTHQTSYSELTEVFKKSDADPNKNGNIIWFYTGTSVSFSKFGSSVGSTNREHVWAKNGGDTFPEKSQTGSDAHHLRPTEMQLNGIRSNYGFDEVSQTTQNIAREAGKSDYGTFPDGLCYLSGNFFYPAKGYRGATARILFYVQTRWGNQYNLDFIDGATSNNGKNIGKISTLMKWHLEEPPTDQEIRRNNVVASIQGNRNPFIDHPEYAEVIYCNNGESYSNTLKNVVAQYGSYLNDQPTPPVDDTPSALTLSVPSLDLKVGDVSQQIAVTATPSSASNEVTWSTSNAQVAAVNNGVVTAVGAGTATITATSTKNSNVKASLTVTVTAQSVTPDPPDLPVDDTPTSLTLSVTSLDLKVGNSSQQILVTATPSSASNEVTWSTSNAQVAAVSNGVVTAVGAGTATITATSTKNSNVKASLTVTVTAQSVTPDPPAPTDTTAFKAAVGNIANTTVLSDRYNAIKAAIDEYLKLDDAAKATVTQEYEVLQAAVTVYNAYISQYNEDFTSATQLTSQAVALGISTVLLAIFVIVTKRLGR